MLFLLSKGGIILTYDAILVVQFLFRTIWQFFTSWYIPGTHMTPVVFFLGTAFAGVIINFFLRLFNVNMSVSLAERDRDEPKIFIGGRKK